MVHTNLSKIICFCFLAYCFNFSCFFKLINCQYYVIISVFFKNHIEVYSSFLQCIKLKMVLIIPFLSPITISAHSLHFIVLITLSDCRPDIHFKRTIFFYGVESLISTLMTIISLFLLMTRYFDRDSFFIKLFFCES